MACLHQKAARTEFLQLVVTISEEAILESLLSQLSQREILFRTVGT